jgi:hypothetical protein
MELRLAHIEPTHFPLPAGEGGAKRRVRGEISRGRFLFVTYAVEIEGEAPLIFVAEAADA